MSRSISIHYTVFSKCIKSVDIEDYFNIEGKNAHSVYQELCQKLPEESLNDIEYEDECHEIESNSFVSIDRIEVFDNTKDVIVNYGKIKETLEF